MIGLHKETPQEEKLSKMLEEVLERVHKPKTVITYNVKLKDTYGTRVKQVVDAEPVIQKIRELHEGEQELHINIDI